MQEKIGAVLGNMVMAHENIERIILAVVHVAQSREQSPSVKYVSDSVVGCMRLCLLTICVSSGCWLYPSPIRLRIYPPITSLF
jgi:hypothetical protein